MNYSKAVRGSHINPVPAIQSAADTEMRRQLTTFELRALSEKFSLETVASHVQKVSGYLLSVFLKISYISLVWIWISEVPPSTM